MFCPNCGKNNPDDSRFCESCGTTMNGPGAAATPPAQPAQPAQPAYNPPPQQQATYAAPAQPAYNAAPPAAYYQQPAYGAADLNKPLSVGGYILTFLVMAIPLVGIIMTFVWAFGSNANINRRNYCRALLIIALIMIVLTIVLSIVFASVLPDILDSLSEYSYNYGN